MSLLVSEHKCTYWLSNIVSWKAGLSIPRELGITTARFPLLSSLTKMNMNKNQKRLTWWITNNGAKTWE